jgi:pyridoxamine 5'-phosphate oxidase
VNPHAAITIVWKELDRQVSAAGEVERVPDEESAAYFRTRPREARIGAWASRQSEALGDREELEARFAEIDARYPGDDVPLPPFWGGFVLRPNAVEFWQGRPFRLHDRFRYERDADAWNVERLYP